MIAREANFDGLIGPTHNYGGLSDGNIASSSNSGLTSRPREAVLQGLDKMLAMHEAGLWQGVLPPHQRPFLPFLWHLGYKGTDQAIYKKGWKSNPCMMKNILSASSMWAANAATVSPSPDCADGKLHLTPANLSTMLHRSLEHEQTERTLKKAFPFAVVHPALPSQSVFSDEGAANHVRLCAKRGAPGVELFVFGRIGSEPHISGFPARQTREAAEAIARIHNLRENRTVYARQSRAAINAGAFHNDVVCVGAKETLFFHELAFENFNQVKADIQTAAKGLFDPVFVEVPLNEVPIEAAIKSYLFNSMLVQFPDDDRLTLIAPTETRDMESTRQYCEKLTSGNGPIGTVKFVDVRQSMRNGGGPACLRLRVTLTEDEWDQVRPTMKMDKGLHVKLTVWAKKYYRETLAPKDLQDPKLMVESFAALDELTNVLDLGSDFYPFQRD